jgi:hypothetical protein
MNPNIVPKTVTAFILRSTVNGAQVYLGKGGQMVQNHKQAFRFSREQVKQIASSVSSETMFFVTSVSR